MSLLSIQRSAAILPLKMVEELSPGAPTARSPSAIPRSAVTPPRITAAESTIGGL